jgi:hypothetical protein
MCLAVFGFAERVQFDLLAGQLQFLTTKARHRVFEQAERTSTQASRTGSTSGHSSRVGGVRIVTIGLPTEAVEEFSGRSGIPITVAIVAGHLGSRSSWLAGHAYHSVVRALDHAHRGDLPSTSATSLAMAIQKPSIAAATLTALRRDLLALEDLYTGILRSTTRVHNGSTEAATAASTLVCDLAARTRPFRSHLEGTIIDLHGAPHRPHQVVGDVVHVTITGGFGQAIQISKTRSLRV